MSPPDEFALRVSLWIVDCGFQAPETGELPGVLQTQRIDGLFHYLVLDQDEAFEAALKRFSATRYQRGDVNLDRAVNALLARDHASVTESVTP